MRLISETPDGSDCGERYVAFRDERERAARPSFGAKRRRRDAKHPAETAREGLGGKTILFRPAIEPETGVIQKIARKDYGRDIPTSLRTNS